MLKNVHLHIAVNQDVEAILKWGLHSIRNLRENSSIPLMDHEVSQLYHLPTVLILFRNELNLNEKLLCYLLIKRL